MMRRPSAYLPVAMSLLALAMVLAPLQSGVAQGGHIARDPDEGAVAHLFQLLMVQMPIMLFFAVKWLRRARDRPCACWPAGRAWLAAAHRSIFSICEE